MKRIDLVLAIVLGTACGTPFGSYGPWAVAATSFAASIAVIVAIATIRVIVTLHRRNADEN